MKAYVYIEPYKFVEEERGIPQPGVNQVRVQVRAASICGSDLHGFKGQSAMRVAPLVMGHEFAGIVDAVGEGVNEELVGTRVSANPAIPCGECSNCKEGRFNVCENRLSIGTTMKAGPWDGAFAEYCLVPAKNLVRMADDVSFEEAALFEPAAVSLRAAKMMGDIKGQTVAVFGAGPIGLLAMQAARILGAARVIAIDRGKPRLELAVNENMADRALNSTEVDIVEEVMKLTDGEGAYASLDAVGCAASLNTCIKMTRNAGTVSLVGMAAETMDGYSYKECVAREMNLKGSYTYINEISEAAQYRAEGKYNLGALITSVVPMSQIQEKMTELASGQSSDVKVVLVNR